MPVAGIFAHSKEGERERQTIKRPIIQELTFHSLASPDSLVPYHAYPPFHRFRLRLGGGACVMSDAKNAPYEYDRDVRVNDARRNVANVVGVCLLDAYIGHRQNDFPHLLEGDTDYQMLVEL